MEWATFINRFRRIMDSSQNAYNEDTSALVARLDELERALFQIHQAEIRVEQLHHQEKGFRHHDYHHLHSLTPPDHDSPSVVTLIAQVLIPGPLMLLTMTILCSGEHSHAPEDPQVIHLSVPGYS
ncbi:hypothetical protein BTVI_98928 [Pitangus sulphuratus]|nr:hypothetical protein BTVI_98928 [Pitangus sulphuratus]